MKSFKAGDVVLVRMTRFSDGRSDTVDVEIGSSDKSFPAVTVREMRKQLNLRVADDMKLYSEETAMEEMAKLTPTLPFVPVVPSEDLTGQEGVMVTQISLADMSARISGLKDRDLIVSLGKDNVANLEEFNKMMAEHKPGDTIQIGYFRKGNGIRTTLELGPARPSLEAIRCLRVMAGTFDKFEDTEIEFGKLEPSLGVLHVAEKKKGDRSPGMWTLYSFLQ